jgi:hypothetical protein
VIEYLRSDNAELQISFTAASGVTSVVFSAYDLDTASFVQSGNTSSAASQVFTGTLTTDSTKYDRNLKIEWVSSTASGASSTISYYSMKRPYATVSRIKELVDIDTTTVSNPTLTKYEKKARLFIDAYTGIKFAKEYDSIVAFGDNSDTLLMPVPVLKIDQIYEDDILVYDLSTIGASVNKFDYTIEVGPSKTIIKIKNDALLNIGGINEFPDTNLIRGASTFVKDRSYRIVGSFGFEYVPNEVELATALLVDDYICNDWNIRNKGIESIKTDSYDLQYGKMFASGTGNLLVDSLLAPWVGQPRFMVI